MIVMKKLCKFLLVAVMVLGLAGCMSDPVETEFDAFHEVMKNQVVADLDAFTTSSEKAINNATDVKEFEKISQAVAHKPFNPQSHSYQKFKENSLQQIAQLQKKYPHIDFQKEIHIFLDDAVSIG